MSFLLVYATNIGQIERETTDKELFQDDLITTSLILFKKEKTCTVFLSSCSNKSQFSRMPFSDWLLLLTIYSVAFSQVFVTRI